MTSEFESDPRAALEEARKAAANRRYQDALDTHVWFHLNALKYRPSLAGVRLSYALDDWVKLGTAYPPALEELRRIRDDAELQVRRGGDIRNAFIDVAAISRVLGEDSRTRDLFAWLDSNDTTMARTVYDAAQGALIRTKEFSLCGRYVHADESFSEILGRYQMATGSATSRPHAEMALAALRQICATRAAALVGLLVLTDRKADALRIADLAAAEWNDADSIEMLAAARKGVLPNSPLI